MELRSQNDNELHVEEFEKSGLGLEMYDTNTEETIVVGREGGFGGYKNYLEDLYTHRDKIIEEQNGIKYKDLEDMVFSNGIKLCRNCL